MKVLLSNFVVQGADYDTQARPLPTDRNCADPQPRQCGKTTMARIFVPPDSLNCFDLEDPVSLARLDEPMTTLRDLRGLVVIDEVQRRPDLFPILRVLVDPDSSLPSFSFSAAHRPNRWPADRKP